MIRRPVIKTQSAAIDLRRRRVTAPVPTLRAFEYTQSENWQPQPHKVRVVVEKSNQNCFWIVKQMVEATHYEGYNGEIVVLGYNVSESFSAFKNRYPNDKIICYQLEQIFNNQSWWFDANAKSGPVYDNTQHILGWLKGCDEIWDYDLDNIDFLKSLGFTNIKFRPMKWFEGINNITSLEKDIDVLFYGGMNHKRSVLTSQLGGYKHKVLTNNFQAWGETLNEYIGRSKIILNLHFYDSHIQEQVRIFPLVANDCCVLSEVSRRNYFDGLIQEFATGEEMIEKIDFLLADDNWRRVSEGIGAKFKDTVI